jgi:hypothetical protein
MKIAFCAMKNMLLADTDAERAPLGASHHLEKVVDVILTMTDTSGSFIAFTSALTNLVFIKYKHNNYSSQFYAFLSIRHWQQNIKYNKEKQKYMNQCKRDC